MRIAGYVRQTPGRTDPDTAFAQSERIRRWVLDTANELIAVCQDHHTSTAPTERPGFKALLDLTRSNAADAVVVANLAALSPDKVTQEIMIQDLRTSGATVIATEEHDLMELKTAEGDHTRMLVRDVVSRLYEYQEAFGLSTSEDPAVSPATIVPVITDIVETTDVVVELIAEGA